jgi:hypothetical protein
MISEILKQTPAIAIATITIACIGATEFIKRCAKNDIESAITILASASIGVAIGINLGISWHIGLVLGLAGSGLITGIDKLSITEHKPDETKPKATNVEHKPDEPISYEQLVEAVCQLSQKELQLLCQQWLETNYNISLLDADVATYDDWLAYFKTMPSARLKLILQTGMLNVEAEAALRRWHDIITHPYRMDKIYQAGLKDVDKVDIVALAKEEGGQMKVLEAMRDRIANQLQRGVGARDTALLTKELGNILSQMTELKRRQAPDGATKLGQLLAKRNRHAHVRKNSIDARVKTNSSSP